MPILITIRNYVWAVYWALANLQIVKLVQAVLQEKKTTKNILAKIFLNLDQFPGKLDFVSDLKKPPFWEGNIFLKIVIVSILKNENCLRILKTQNCSCEEMLPTKVIYKEGFLSKKFSKSQISQMEN